MTLFRALGMLVFCLAVAACERHAKPSNVGWIKVTLDTAYKGRKLHFVAYAECVRAWVPGGSFGATPGTGAITMKPVSVGSTMPDGSFVGFRMPDVCPGFFGKTPVRDYWEWTRSPFVPLMVWGDRRRRPHIYEVYLAEEAYTRPSSKLTPPVAFVEPLATVPDEIAERTRRWPRNVVRASGLVDFDKENEIGDPPGTLDFRATAAWPNLPETQKGEDSPERCLLLVRYGRLVAPVHAPGWPRSELASECRKPLATLVPFIWDGHRFTAQPERAGIAVFQRIERSMRNAPYYDGDGKQVRSIPGAGLPWGAYTFTTIATPIAFDYVGV